MAYLCYDVDFGLGGRKLLLSERVSPLTCEDVIQRKVTTPKSRVRTLSFIPVEKFRHFKIPVSFVDMTT